MSSPEKAVLPVDQKLSLECAQSVLGALLGGAVGDAVGLPYEGLSKRRALRMWGKPDRHRFLFRRGMVSDDTEHACMTLEAFCAAPNDPDEFARRLGRRFRWWLLGVPIAMGRATLRACLRLWMGVPPSRSGVFSAGNGPAMRSAVLGAAIDDLDRLNRFVAASTRITHTDPKAMQGAMAVALAAWCSKRGLFAPATFLEQWRAMMPESSAEFNDLLARTASSASNGETTAEFAATIGCEWGVSGYIYDTVPVAIHCWWTHPNDLRTAVCTIIECGGDADTTAAVVGGIVGAGVGRQGVSSDWLNGLWEWPRSVSWMTRLAGAVNEAAQSGVSARTPSVIPLVGLMRNSVFFLVILGHLARRALPPY